MTNRLSTEVIEEMTGDIQRMLQMPAPKIHNNRTKHVLCDLGLSALTVAPNDEKSVTRGLVRMNARNTRHIGADLLANGRYLLILRPGQSFSLRCGPPEEFTRSPAIVFILAVDYGFNEVIPIRRLPQMLTVIASEGPPIKLRAIQYYEENYATVRRVQVPSDTTVNFTMNANVVYEITVEPKSQDRDPRLQDPTTIINLVAPAYEWQQPNENVDYVG